MKKIEAVRIEPSTFRYWDNSHTCLPFLYLNLLIKDILIQMAIPFSNALKTFTAELSRHFMNRFDLFVHSFVSMQECWTDKLSEGSLRSHQAQPKISTLTAAAFWLKWWAPLMQSPLFCKAVGSHVDNNHLFGCNWMINDEAKLSAWFKFHKMPGPDPI